MADQSDQFAAAVRQAANRSEVSSAIALIHQQLQERIDQRQPICVASGKCCQFERYGHRLYITTAEMAAFVASHGQLPRPPANADWDRTGCPFQIGRLCGVHAIRPFGCRIFFCDPTATEWQQQEYEKFHRQIKDLHQTLLIPYFYMEWRQALINLNLISI
ncbi:MAG: YkgJ family cysteine cluster protein [Phycisphaerales bacterium]|jgi:Fe-S-cluster containining protein|nr:YkgJ family cysteine cluster protein [Phycisphaerales bacterium]